MSRRIYGMILGVKTGKFEINIKKYRADRSDFFRLCSISQQKKVGSQHLSIESMYRFRYNSSIRIAKEVRMCG